MPLGNVNWWRRRMPRPRMARPSKALYRLRAGTWVFILGPRTPGGFSIIVEYAADWKSNVFLEAEAADLGVSVDELLPRLDVVVDMHGYPWGEHSAAAGKKRFLRIAYSKKSTDRILSPQLLEQGWQFGDEGSVEVLCGVAALASIPAEHSRLALHALTLLSPRGHQGALAAGCRAAVHKDAAVRDQAMELLLCLAWPRDLEAVRRRLRSQGDAHASRILRELEQAVQDEPRWC